jgi:hypothetical protein
MWILITLERSWKLLGISDEDICEMTIAFNLERWSGPIKADIGPSDKYSKMRLGISVRYPALDNLIQEVIVLPHVFGR